MFIITPNITL